MNKELRRWLRYNVWANRETLKSLDDAAPESALKRMAHIVAAEALWLDRVEGKSSGAVWPKLPIAEIAKLITNNDGRWQKSMRESGETWETRKVPYKNSKGEPWSSSVADIIQHVVIHAEHHRGQIASDLRAAGWEPAYTDFIHAARNGFLD